ncbi:helix-turn-helix transcriptional regulator [Streptomyces sp. V4-01]|uniref:Helix-turn-helix transcriptional regulator n=1 Tax=Actinacidiphila polyblastidii TaxID=3110430 RepID=A0ABU7PLN0_9ACTN|nr:helix-turn-helix transcriptional regulator [Streptomyces sp. V4-01]
MPAYEERRRVLLAEIDSLSHLVMPLHKIVERLTPMLRNAIGFTASCWHSVDLATGLITSTMASGLDPHGLALILRLELWADDGTRFDAIRRSGRAATSLVSSTGGRPERSVRYREALSPYGFADELRINFDLQGTTWGSASFIREAGAPAYTGEDLRLAERIARPLAVLLRTQLLWAALLAMKQAARSEPAVAILAGDNRVVFANQRAQAMIADTTDDVRLPSGLPSAFEMMAEKARRAFVDGPSGELPPVSLCMPSGQWLTLHTSTMGGGPGGYVALVVVPATATEIMSTALLAFALSPRERAVVVQVVRGLSTRDIASSLAITPATVQDYLKSVFDKTGVRSRRELVALLTPHQSAAA